MPQIKLEYSSNVKFEKSFSDIFEGIHAILSETIGAKIYDCKSRAIRLENFYIGNSKTDHAMVHVETAILEGRDKGIKKELGERILKHIRNSVSKRNKPDIQITVEIRDIIKEQYFKEVVNPGE